MGIRHAGRGQAGRGGDVAWALEGDPHFHGTVSYAVPVVGAPPPLPLQPLLLLLLLLAHRPQTSPVAMQGGVRRIAGARTS